MFVDTSVSDKLCLNIYILHLVHTTFYPTIEFVMAEPVTKKARSDDDDNVALVLYGVDDLRMVSWGD